MPPTNSQPQSVEKEEKESQPPTAAQLERSLNLLHRAFRHRRDVLQQAHDSRELIYNLGRHTGFSASLEARWADVERELARCINEMTRELRSCERAYARALLEEGEDGEETVKIKD